LTLIMMLISGASLILAGTAFVTYELITFRLETPRRLEALADLIAANSIPALTVDNRSAAQDMLNALNAQEHVRAACVYTRDGRIFASYRKDPYAVFPPAPDPRGDLYDFEGGDVVLARRMRLDGEPVGTLYIRSDVRRTYVRLWRYVGIVTLVLLGSWLLAWLLSSMLQRVISRPILDLADVAQRVRKDETYAVRAVKRSGDEIGVLIDGFNAMLERVAERETALEEARGLLEQRVDDRTKALHESERRFRSVLQNLQLVALLLDRDGSITFCNPYLAQLTGWSDRELLDHDYFELLVPAEDRDAARAEYFRGMRSGSIPVHAESEVTTRTGERRFVSWTHTVLEEAGGWIVGMASLGIDITEQRLLEERRRQSQKLEAVGRLAGGVAHDFNNLLTIILGYSDLTLLSVTDPTVAENVHEVKRAAERAAALTKQLLAFSRRQVLQPTVLDLNVVVGDTEKMLRRLIGEDIELRSTAAPELGAVKADRGQLEQVLVNLAVNARDAMPSGGRLLIEMANVELDAAYARVHAMVQPGHYVRLSVSDTGHGMDPATQARIFEPFFTTKKEGKGTGLGLATVYGIVKQSGGYVWVYSEPGRGTTFKIYLPRVFEASERGAPASLYPAGLRGTETVLLVEDDEELRKMTAEVLRRFGFDVMQVSSAEDALDLVETCGKPIHIVLTDLVLPRLTGRDLADQLAVTRPKIRVVFMSGYADQAAQHLGLLEVDQPFLSKPFTPDLLVRKLRDVLDAPAGG
jgi:two-component system, cell cycle sensor histidine kinase and response regulator CckA